HICAASSVRICATSSLPICAAPSVPPHLCHSICATPSVPSHQCPAVPPHQCTSVLPHQCTSVPSQCTSVPPHQCPPVPPHQCPPVPPHQCPPVPPHQCTSAHLSSLISAHLFHLISLATMSKRSFSAEEAYQILSQADESNGELSFSHSLSNSDSELDINYEPVLSSGTLSDSEEEDIRPAKQRHSGEEAVASTSTAVPSTSTAVPSTSTAVPSTSTAVPRKERPRTHASLPYALQNPLWLPPNSGEANIPPFTAQPGVQVDTENFSSINFLNLIFTEDMLSNIVAQCNLYAQQFKAIYFE
ncbi:hypothetical protein AB205_0212360, partial [Aquarana catesbeiana]